MRLTDLGIKALQPGRYYDDITPAFGIRVGKTKRTFIVQRGKERQYIRLGHWPQMSLAEARTKGKQLLAATQLNHERVTFQEAYDLFCKTHMAQKKPRTQYDYKRVLERHYLPTLATKRLDAVTSHMCLAITDELADTPSELIHATSIGKTFFKWCIRRHYLTVSPLQVIQLQKPKKRKRTLSDEELREVWHAALKFPDPYGSLIRLVILTGMRRTECAALQTTWVKGNRIHLPAAIVKNSHDFLFPIGPTTQQLLDGLKTNWHLLLPQYPQGPRPFSTFSVTKKEFDLTHTVKNYTVHDLRRTYRTNLARLRVPRDICERLINHRSARSDLDEIYDQYEAWDEQVEAVLKFDNWLKQTVLK